MDFPYHVLVVQRRSKAMKKASGSIRIDLAQYREMEVFTQFSSDLDAATKEELEYGRGLMELLKQPLYHPLSLHEKVITLCAATHKVLLMDVEKTKIKQFQSGYASDVRDRASGNRSGNRREESPDRGTDHRS